ncbi:gp53-like domain-containing protein [Bacteroides thetaiotaomicron]|jgi:hypothetical protein|uniref:gp53-like domain-containing protein n=1 Tax=Bacteroides thetaiotaomicron TaxID=818 RepID=UPI00232CC2E9|nr:hypothetical protein [Bacteroides thetaiotaomicron]MDC2102510.1 hypothetical protein [Bacteroides thetaiotaomicron]
MPLKKKRISELNEASDMKGFYTIGYRIVSGVKTSLKFGLEKIQTALDNMHKATSDAKTATTDMRQLEATVEGNESTRETAESRRNASEQSRQTAETERSREEQAREAAESVRITNENARKSAETGRSSAETSRASEENKRTQNEDARKTAEGTRGSNETKRVNAETARVEAESKRKAEYAGIVQEMTSATEEATGQITLVKQLTDDANAAKSASVEQTALAKKATDAANTAAGSVNAAKEAATTAAAGANAAKTASEAQTALAKKATDDANAAKSASVTQTGLAKKATDDANAAALAANNAVSGVDAKVQAAIDKLVAGAPDALDTLIELANALNNDPNFAATMATELGKKLNVSDIVNNLTSGGTGKVLSAEQGKALKAALNAHNHDAVYEKIITKLTAFNKNFGTAAGTVCEGNDARLSNARTPLAHSHKKADISDFPTSMPASDVPAWAKAANKPTYTASEVGASPTNHNHTGTYEPAFTKNTAFNKNFGSAAGTVCEGNDARLSDARTPKAHTHKKSEISDFPTSMPASDVPAWAKATNKPSYTASEVGASPSNHNHAGTYEPAFTKKTAFNKDFGTAAGTVCEGNDARLSNARTPLAHSHKKADISDFPTSMPASDVPAWAKAANKPTYTASEVGASPTNHNHDADYQPLGDYAEASHTHDASDITPDSTHRFVSDSEKSTWNSKAAGNHNHSGVYQPVGSYAPSSHSHTASDITPDSTHRFVTDSEKSTWNSKAAGNHNHDSAYQPKGSYAPSSHGHTASEITLDATHRFVTDTEKNTWSGKAEGNHNHDSVYQAKGNYAASSHTHLAADIEESTTRKFMTTDEKNILSSLGTNYAKADFSNVITKSLGQNGYYKFPDGLMIQWGYSSTSGIGKTVYFNTTFYDSNYTVLLTGTRKVHSNYIYSFDVFNKYASYFVMDSVYQNVDSDAGGFSIAFYWFAIGRWK